MKNNKFVFTIFLTILCLTFYGCDNNTKSGTVSNAPEDVYLSAKTDSYDSIENLENSSDLIVIGTKTKELESNVLYDENGIYQIAYTYSSFKIDEVIKNRIKETSQEIKIFENQAFDKKNNEVLHIAGYVNMIEGNNYILYLRFAEEGYYIPLAVTFGKVPLTNSEINKIRIKMRNDDTNSNEVIDNLHKDIQKKYKSKIE